MALKYVHSCNILHRDLKTQNIMLSGPQQRTIKLGDFGIAKVLGSGRDLAATVVGTPHYLSPELCKGSPYDHKSDIWALGCVLYELCALRKPFDASNIPGIIFKIMRCEAAPIDARYSDDLRSMLASLLNANPDARPSTEEIEATPIVRVGSV
jgi:NIMA (never in mitosis gene a)-related kinase 1/4/5